MNSDERKFHVSDKELLDRMKKGWRSGLADGTRCGSGSMLKHTANVRRWLPEIVRKYGIRSVADAGAGDLVWIKKVEWDVDYRPYDLVKWSDSVTQWDISRVALPPCDAILCRMVFNHLGRDRVIAALEMFKQSAEYLIATTTNRGDGSGHFTWLDLREYIGDPLESVRDGPDEGCKLAIWRICGDL